jgi:PAS domain S-box-containing protein
MLGYASPQELIEQVPDVRGLYVDPATRERFMERVEADGKVVGFEYEVRRKDGTTIWVSENTSMMYDEEGIPVGFEGTSMDVTARRAAESSGQDRAEQLRQADLKRRALLGKLFRVQQEERRRISSDLHADTIQQMTVASLRLEVLRQKAEGAPEVQAGLADLEVLVSQVIARLRRLAFDLRPPQLDEVGLAAAISETAATTEGSLQVRVQDDLQASVPLEVRSNAFSIISEALTNARKHSGATSALVQLSTRGEGMLAKVIDEGAGFSPGGNDLSDQWHLGMSDMHERAEMGGGWLRVESAPGQGSAVEFFLPFPAAADAGTTATEG